MSCITGCWDQKRVYSCRQTFTPRPVLCKKKKNTMLDEVVENLRKRFQTMQLNDYYEPGDVECDVCTEEKNKAIKSCLVCLESYCQTHFEHHEEFHSKKRHKITDATEQLKEMICPQHYRLLEMYCCTDQCCICVLCMLDEHKKHKTISPAEERTEKQKLLEETQKAFQQRIQEKETELEKLKETVKSHKRSAKGAIKDIERIFTDLIHSIERSRSDLTQLIRDQEKVLLSQAEGFLERLRQEIEDLRRRDTELEQFLHTDHIHFLQRFQSYNVPPASEKSSSIAVGSCVSFADLRVLISQLNEKLKHVFKEEDEKILRRVRYVEMIPTPEYKSRNEFLQHYQEITLDRNTAHDYLKLSERSRVVTNMNKIQSYYDYSDRFDHWYQVLCCESLNGRCYWEVEWKGWVHISVSYKSIDRKGRGRKCEFGSNNWSWSLSCSSCCSFFHNGKGITLPAVPSSSRIGVYVDHSSGTLSFYSVSDTMTLIHRVHTTFTQPLYAGFWVYYDAQVTLCAPAT